MEFNPHTLLSSLSDTTRLRLVFLLSQYDELCVCDLVYALDVQQPKVSKHLGVLRKNTLIVGRREGQWIHYRLNDELPLWAGQTIDALISGCAQQEPFLGDLQRLLEGRAVTTCV
ncbi:MAG: metalloregulator ArsR/SmtB family transcription factor [Candidatus Thiodiazotropha sp. (ex Codakia rugifera)]|nr:metalloregulator ArsR/SmtB family transcription factor [Candidatus Thiodiazotropha sp. (ex Codakia rugifera)]